ncbi:hypothetical protein [Methylobacterium sp. CM6247]
MMQAIGEGWCCRSGMAMKSSRYWVHGGASTEPRTAVGKARAQRSNWKHGRRSAEYIAMKRAIAQAGRDLGETMQISEQMLRDAGR